jgi:hypothetical protein
VTAGRRPNPHGLWVRRANRRCRRAPSCTWDCPPTCRRWPLPSTGASSHRSSTRTPRARRRPVRHPETAGAFGRGRWSPSLQPRSHRLAARTAPGSWPRSDGWATPRVPSACRLRSSSRGQSPPIGRHLHSTTAHIPRVCSPGGIVTRPKCASKFLLCAELDIRYWDRRDDAGGTVGRGVYVVRPATNRGVAGSRELPLLRR